MHAGSAAPSMRGGSEDGSLRPRRELRHTSTLLARFPAWICDSRAGSAAPSTRGGSEDGSPRPRRELRRPSWYLAQYGPDYATLESLEAASGELGRAAALAIGWQQDAAGDSASVSGDSSQQGDDGGIGVEGRAVSWPVSRLLPLDPQSPVGLLRRLMFSRLWSDCEVVKRIVLSFLSMRVASVISNWDSILLCYRA